MLRDGYNAVQFEGTIVRTAQEPTLLRENNIQRDQGWSWIVLFAAFLTLFITNGMHASFGILYAALISHFGSGREETAWIGSISLGLLCFFSPVASVLIEQIGCRATSIIGAFLCSLGFLITSFATGIALLYFSHGLLFGLGTSLTYTAAMTVVGRSFERRRNIATGLCTSGSQFGGISLAPLSQVLFDRLGFANTFRIFSGLLLVVAISSLVYRSELSGNTSGPTSAKKSPKEMLNVWKSKAYIVWALGTTMVTLGYNIPRYTLAKYASDQGISKDASAWLVSYLCASSAIGRITFGRLCEWVPKLYLCQACIIGCAFSAFLYPFLKSYVALVITVIIFGLPDGGFVASLSMVTTEIVGPEKMVEGFGFMLFCQSYSNVIGPPLSGMLYDTYKSYKAAFCFAAVPEIIGFLMLFLIPYYRRNQVKYTHEIEYGSNSGIMMNGNGAASTLNPISDTPILPAVEQQGEYNVVINLTSDNPDIRLVNVVIHKAGGSETTGVTCTDGEADDQILDGGIVNKAVEEIEVPVCAGKMPVCTSALVTESAVEQPNPEAGALSIVVEPEAIMLSALSPMKSSSTQTVIHDSSAETKYANTSTVNEDRILPTALASSASRENVSQIIDVEISAPVQNFPSTQLVAIVSNESQTDPITGVISLGLQIKTSNKSLPLEASTSVIQIASNTMLLSDGYENPVEEIIHLQTEQDVPKISPPPSHKHHVNNMKAEVHHMTNADVSSGCHDSVVDNSPEAMLAELDTLVQGSELPPKPCLTSPFTPDVNIQEASLMKCAGLEPGLPGFTPEPGLNQNQESLMLSTTFIPEMTSPCISTAFSTEPPHMSGINDVLTQKQLPEPLKPTSLSSVRGNDQQGSQSQDMPRATSPLSCELSTVIADVIQSLTSQQSQKSNKESTISSMADNSQCTSEPIDHVEKKQATLVENSTIKEPPNLGINVECSSQPSSELSSYCKLQTSLLHSMQSIVAEGCPEDVALLEDISIDLTLEKDPSFASIVVIDDIDEQNNTTDLNFPCLSNEPAVSQASRVSELPHFANGLAHEPSMMTSNAVANQPSHGATSTQVSTFSCQVQGFLGVAHEPSTNTHILTQEQHYASRISSQDQHFYGVEHEAVIITLQEPTSIHPNVIQTQVFPCVDHAPSITHTGVNPSMISGQVQPFSPDLPHETANMLSTVVSSQLPREPSNTHLSVNQQQVSGISSQEQHIEQYFTSGLAYDPTSSVVSSQLPHEPSNTQSSVNQQQASGISSPEQHMEQYFTSALAYDPTSSVVSSQLPHEPSNTQSSVNQQQASGISSPEQHIEQYFTSALAYDPTSSVVSSQLPHEPINTHLSVNQQQASGISSPEQHIEQYFTSGLAYDPTSSVVSSQLSHEFTITQPSVIPAQERHFLTATQEATLPSSQEQRFTALMHEPDIIPSCGISNQHEPIHLLTNTHPSVILVQELQFPNVTQECTNAHPTVSPTQKQPFPSVAMEASIIQPSAISNEEQSVPSLTQELTIVLPSGTAEMVLQDTIVLELFPQTAGHDGTGYDATMSHEKLAKPIESTNPFYQDINQ